MRKIILALAVVTLLAFVASANAAPLRSETITSSLSFPSYPAGPPNFGTYGGTFTAAGPVADAGTVTAQALFGSVPAPSTGVLETERTLAGSDGTLYLRCTEIAKSFADPSAVPGTGTCAVLGGTGAYSGVTGSGKVTSLADLLTGAFTDTLVLGS